MEAYTWSGFALPPRNDGEPPISLPAPEGAYEPAESPPVWARLTYPDGHVETVKGFAVAWTKDAVRVQYVKFVAEHVWVAPDKVKRREIQNGRPPR